MPEVYLGLGSNVGGRARFLTEALREIQRMGPVRASSLYVTDPQGGPRQGDYLNAAVCVSTDWPLDQLHRRVQALERLALRQPAVRFGPRTLDIDILFYGREAIRTVTLLVPHPRILQRRFVLEPLCELAPDLILPDGTRLALWRFSRRRQGVRKVPGTEAGQWTWYR
ncbi:MAG: 2-amino-4-hydroxy-6-hydroxymethyldihydropteridine diphosphokinase [Thermaerobacter sp.]|nr:2-amino-4-hydroxy-6-hydroxymethyldihydropteridine diphosphokinase [Thermaerobacter sp.]